MKIEVEAVKYGNRVFVFNKQQIMQIDNMENCHGKFLKLSCPSLLTSVFGRNQDELIRELGRDINISWNSFAIVPDSELSDESIQTKNKLLSLITCTELQS